MCFKLSNDRVLTNGNDFRLLKLFAPYLFLQFEGLSIISNQKAFDQIKVALNVCSPSYSNLATFRIFAVCVPLFVCSICVYYATVKLYPFYVRSKRFCLNTVALHNFNYIL